jgi:hypothetical protein
VSTTQSNHPWRATVRTLFAIVVGLASSWGVVAQALNLDPTWGWVAIGAALAATVTRVLANPTVEALLKQYLPWLSAEPRVKRIK